MSCVYCGVQMTRRTTAATRPTQNPGTSNALPTTKVRCFGQASMIALLEVLVAACLLLNKGQCSDAASDHNHQRFSSFTSRQNNSVNPSEDAVNLFPETEALAYYTDDENDSIEFESPSVVASSLLYEGGSVVSTEAITCQGGGFFEVQTHDLHSEYESESEDEDDDDDDGHSLILSNACLRQNRGHPYQVPDSYVQSRPEPRSAAQLTMSSTIGDSGGYHAVLSLRGGGATNMGSEFAKRLLVAAIVTLIYEAVLGHFLEFVKIVMQTSPQGTSYGDVIRTITAKKGIAGIWDGFVPWGVVQSIFKGGVFGLAHSIATSVLLSMLDEGLLALTLAGGIAGGFQGYVLSPTLLLKTRVMTNPIFREQMSVLRTTWLSFRIGADVVAQEGLGALMKGSNVFATKRVFDWATRFYFSDLFEALIRHQKGESVLSAGEKVSATLLGGTASTLSTLPLDVLVAKTQDAKKAGVKVSAWTLFKADLQEKGWAGLYDSYMRGFEARLLHVCFTTAVMKVGAPLMYDAMFGKSP